MLLTVEEYNALGFDGGEDEETCEKALERSQRMINLLTDGKCDDGEGGVLPAAALDSVKQAVAAQAEQYLEAGTAVFGGKVTVGDFSYDRADSIAVVSPLALAILKMSGLYYLGVRTAV